jgi:hypothetical protein
MRFSWRADANRLLSHRAWVDCLDDKNRKPGTSAPTLAVAWSGPLDLLGGLSTNSDLRNLSVQSVTVEAKATFDSHGGNVRNHDLVLRATTAGGEPVVVCVEAKAGELLGATVAEQGRAAAKAKQANPRSNAEARLTDLVARLCRFPITDSRVAQIRYQLLTAWAGTVADAAHASHAVLALHEFRTDDRPEDKALLNGADLERFADAVLGCDVPSAGTAPWCIRVPNAPNVDAALYVAHVVTDLRGEGLARSPKP